MTTVRETKRADELKVGDRVWIDDSHVEILLAEPYNDSFNGVGIFLTYRYLKTRVESVRVPASVDFILVSDEELAAAAAGAERARKIADIRTLADFLEANPEVPLALYPSEQVDLHDGAASVAQVREIAAKFGGRLRDDLDDRTQAYLKFGSFEYRVIAWHHDGRPAEPAPTETIPEAMDRLGLGHSRADDEPDDPTPVSGARVEPHVGGVLSGIAQDGHQLGEPVVTADESLVGETPAEPVHMDLTTGESLCGLAAVTPHKGSLVFREVTCKDCVGAMPLDGC